jgi:hypothetical protein
VSANIGFHDLSAHALRAPVRSCVAYAKQGLRMAKICRQTDQTMRPGPEVVRLHSALMNLARQIVAKNIFGCDKGGLVQNFAKLRVTLRFGDHHAEESHDVRCIEQRCQSVNETQDPLYGIWWQILRLGQLIHEQLASEPDTCRKQRFLASKVVIKRSLGCTCDLRKPFHGSQLITFFKENGLGGSDHRLPALLRRRRLSPPSRYVFFATLFGWHVPIGPLTRSRGNLSVSVRKFTLDETGPVTDTYYTVWYS